jgi:2-aminoadipate transaminase
MPFQLARRAERMNPSIIREILKITERPGVISLAGGLPSPDTFPIEAMREASERVLRDTPREGAAVRRSEGYGPLREWVAHELMGRGLKVDASQVLITTGSQQGLDLVGKILIDAGTTVAVESPDLPRRAAGLCAYEPEFLSVPCDDDGPLPDGSRWRAARVSSTRCRTSRIRAAAA